MTARPRVRHRAVPLAGILLALCLVPAALIGVLSATAAAKRGHAGSPSAEHGPSVRPETPAPGAVEEKRASEREASGKSHGRRHGGADKGRHQGQTEAPEVAAGEQEGGATPALSPAAQTQSSTASGKRRRELERERRRERRQARKDKERETRGEGEGEGEEHSKGKPVPVVVTPPVAVASGATATPSTIAQTPAATGSLPSVVTSAKARSSAGSKARRVHKPAARARHGASRISTRALSVLPAPSTSAQSGQGAGKDAADTKTAATKRHRASSSPLVRTVTQVIDVVPPAIRWVIAGLLALALALALSTRFASRRAQRLARQRKELLEDVGLLQAALLPELPEHLGPIATTAAYRPASGPAAGGDFYDLFALADGRLAVLVGDVSGHGRTALPHTTLVRFTLRAYLEVGMSPREALQAAAPGLERQLGDSFATVVLAIYDPHERKLVYSCAGHPPPVLDRAPSLRQITACSAPPIGVGWPTGTRQTELSIPGGVRACFYTDGVIEAKLDGGLFGVERLREVLAGLPEDQGADELLERVAAAADEHPDDMAACLLEVDGGQASAAQPSVLVEEVEVRHQELTDGRLHRFLAAGGLSDDAIAEAVTRAAGAVMRDGTAVLKLRGGDGRPRVELSPNNVARMRITARSHAGSEVAV
jgi:serine phosphatase RsbU (regulator of sigma subunit)